MKLAEGLPGKPVTINGITYPSVYKANLATGVPSGVLYDIAREQAGEVVV